jgi:hypothetical protein
VPRDKHPKEIREHAPDLDEAWRSALKAGEALGQALLQAADQARGVARSDALLELCFGEPRAPGATLTVNGRPRRLSSVPAFGASTLRGSDLGNSPLLDVLEEGLLARQRSRWAKPLSEADWQAQRPKLLLPRLEAAPEAFPLRLLRLREVAAGGVAGATFAGLVALPTEMSTVLAHQVRQDLARTWGGRPTVLVASPVGEFAGYAGTPWEYLSQSYEASSTLYGRWTGQWLREQVVTLAAGGATPRPGGQVRFTSRAMQRTPIVCNGDRRKDRPNGSYKDGKLRSAALARWLRRARNGRGGFDQADEAVGTWDLLGAFQGAHDRGAWPVHQGWTVALDLRLGGAWTPATVGGREVDDRTVSALLWREAMGEEDPDDPVAVWVFRLALPLRPASPAGSPVPVDALSVRLAGRLFADGLDRRLHPDGRLVPVAGVG